MTIKIKELPELERPYEKLELYGEKALSNAELLAIIIKTGTKEQTSVELAQKILNLNDTKTEGLNFLRNSSLEELMEIKGIGKVKAIQLKAVAEISIRMAKPINYKKIRIKTPDDIAKLLIEELRFEKKEIAKIIILNNKNEILKIKDIALGGADFANVTIKEILSEVLKMNAPRIILAHNHPSGDPTPSKGDILFTDRLYGAAELVEVELLDHLVIGNGKYVSIFSKLVSKTKE